MYGTIKIRAVCVYFFFFFGGGGIPPNIPPNFLLHWSDQVVAEERLWPLLKLYEHCHIYVARSTSELFTLVWSLHLSE